MTETIYRSGVESARRTASSAAEGVSDVASRTAETVADLASQAQETATAVGQQAVNKLGAAADYFREHEMNDIMSDVQSYVKKYPTQALLGAAAVGFLAAVWLRRS